MARWDHGDRGGAEGNRAPRETDRGAIFPGRFPALTHVRRGMARRAMSWLLLFFTLALVGCDHATKGLAQAALGRRGPLPLVPGVLDLHYAENRDIAFSLLRTLPLPRQGRPHRRRVGNRPLRRPRRLVAAPPRLGGRAGRVRAPHRGRGGQRDRPDRPRVRRRLHRDRPLAHLQRGRRRDRRRRRPPRDHRAPPPPPRAGAAPDVSASRGR